MNTAAWERMLVCVLFLKIAIPSAVLLSCQCIFFINWTTCIYWAIALELLHYGKTPYVFELSHFMCFKKTEVNKGEHASADRNNPSLCSGEDLRECTISMHTLCKHENIFLRALVRISLDRQSSQWIDEGPKRKLWKMTWALARIEREPTSPHQRLAETRLLPIVQQPFSKESLSSKVYPYSRSQFAFLTISV